MKPTSKPFPKPLSEATDKADYRSFLIETPINKGSSRTSEHFNEHYFVNKKYSTGIYKGFKGTWSKLTVKQQKAALKKRWYVRWSYRDPDTNKMTRQKNRYAGVNNFNTHSERMEILKKLEGNLIRLLESGINPYTETISHTETHGAFKAIDAAMEIKKLHMKPDSFIRFKSDIKKFKAYLKKNGFERRFITSIDKKTVTNYLNEALKTVSARSRNNYRTNLGSLWQCMEDEGIVPNNFIKTIPMLKSRPKRNKTYTDKQVEELFAYMDKNCRNLLLFIKFVSFNFLRPIEVCRLTDKSFDFDARTLTVQTKGQEMKVKTIPSILMDEIPKEGKGFLFTKDGLWGDWDVNEGSKRGHFSREFAKVKEVFGLGEAYGIYSFRHFYISRLYREMRKEYSPFEVKSKMLLITGHETITALEKYLRSIDAEISEDYSEMIK